MTPKLREPQPGEFVWALEKDVKRVVCELHDHGADGCETQLVRDGEYSASRPFAGRAEALAHADAIRTLLEGGGWRPATALPTTAVTPPLYDPPIGSSDGDGTSPPSLVDTVDERLNRLEARVEAIQRNLDVQFRRIVAMQAQLDRLTAAKV